MNNKITKENTIIILDWDDTLFPTSWLIQNGINIVNVSMKDKLIMVFADLDDILYNLLSKLKNYGQVIIITNALPIWIIMSSSILPKTNKILENIKIISARKKYKSISQNMMDWKRLAFKEEILELIKNNNFINVISVGDAKYEYNALVNLYKITNTNKILKSIKLMERPTNDILIDQLKVLSNVFYNICLSNNHLDLKFKLKI